jgi:plasmid stabilization system protein ParE
MKNYFLSPRAQNDLYLLLLAVAEKNRSATRKLSSGLHATFRFLGRNPSSGELRSDLGEGLRIFTHRNYVIIFRSKNKSVEIVRIIHGARDWLSEFGL